MAGRWPLSAVSGPAGPGAAAKPPRGAPSAQVVTPAHPPPGGAARRGPRIPAVPGFRRRLRSHLESDSESLLGDFPPSLLARWGRNLGSNGMRGRASPRLEAGPRFRAKAPSPCGSRPCGLQSLTRTLKGRLSFTPTGRPDRGLAAAAPPRDPPFGAYAAHPHAPGDAARRGLGTPVVSDFRQKLRPIFASHALIVSLETVLQVSLSRSLLGHWGRNSGSNGKGGWASPRLEAGPRFRAKAPSPCGSRPCGLQSLTRTLKGRFSSTPTGRPDRGLGGGCTAA